MTGLGAIDEEATDQPGRRAVSPSHVAHEQLDHRLVQQRIPARPPLDDDHHDQRHGEQCDRRSSHHRAPTSAIDGHRVRWLHRATDTDDPPTSDGGLRPAERCRRLRRMSRWSGVTVTLGDGQQLRCRAGDRRALRRSAGGDRRAGRAGRLLVHVLAAAATPSGGRPTATQRKSGVGGALRRVDRRPACSATSTTAPSAGAPSRRGGSTRGCKSSPTFGPVDDTPSWAVSCLFIHRTMRRRAVGTALVARGRGDGEGATAPRPSTPSRWRRAASVVPATSTRGRRRCSSPWVHRGRPAQARAPDRPADAALMAGSSGDETRDGRRADQPRPAAVRRRRRDQA